MIRMQTSHHHQPLPQLPLPGGPIHAQDLSSHAGVSQMVNCSEPVGPIQGSGGMRHEQARKRRQNKGRLSEKTAFLLFNAVLCGNGERKSGEHVVGTVGWAQMC